MTIQNLRTLNSAITLKLKPVRQILLLGFIVGVIIITVLGLFILSLNGLVTVRWWLTVYILLLALAGLNTLGLYGVAWLYLVYQHRKEQEEGIFP